MGPVRYVMGATLAALVLSAGTPRPGSAQSRTALVSETAADKKSVPALQRPARLAVRDVALADALARLYETSGVPVSFSPSLLPRQRMVSCACESATVSHALDLLLSKTGLQYREIDGHVLVYRVVQPDSKRSRPRLDIVQPRYASFGWFAEPRAVVQEGTVTGSVIDAGSQRPLSGVQVHVPESGVGSLTNTAGRYILTNVPAGQVTIRAQMIGYATAETVVSIAAGRTVTANFELREEALQLDEVIVTGTAGGTARRALGNVVAAVDVSELEEIAPTATVEHLIGQREAGVMVTPSSGAVGFDGGKIRIRGSSSPGLSNDPIVYIDGIRMNSGLSYADRQGAVSRLNDISPAEIESIEIIKGPAASTLYGTEASNGVIQIITKRGVTGAPSFSASAELGGLWLAKPAEKTGRYWGVLPETGEILEANPYEAVEEALGEAPLSTGLIQNYDVSVRGGTETVRYFGSISRSDREGIVDWSWEKKTNGRLNLGVTPLERLNLDFSLSFVEGRVRSDGPTGNALWAGFITGNPVNCRVCGGRDDPGLGIRFPPVALRDYRENFNEVSRHTASVQVNFNPFDWFRHRLTLGIDATQEERSQFTRKDTEFAWFGSASREGSKSIDLAETRLLTADYNATLRMRVMDDRLGSATSFGLQYTGRERLDVSAEGRNFAAPTLSTIDAASDVLGNESFLENVTVGTYFQQQMDWDERIFVTGAVRFDDNSAFGEDFDAALYPKLSGTWVLHEEAFWDVDVVNRLRLRAAWGQGGTAAGRLRRETALWSPDRSRRASDSHADDLRQS